MTSADWHIIITVLVPFLIGLIIKSPWFRGAPKWLVDLVAGLTPETIDKLTEIVTQPEIRRDRAVELATSYCVKQKIDVNANQVGELVDYLTARFKRSGK